MYRHQNQFQTSTPQAGTRSALTILGVLALLGALVTGCESPAPSQASSSPAASSPTSSAAPAPAPSPTRTFSHSRKTTAPVKVTLTQTRSAADGPVKLTLTFKALADLPRAVARFTVPASLDVLQGNREVDLGAVQRGEQRTVSLTVSAPPRSFLGLGAGVDVHLTSGVKLHKGKTLTFGSPPVRDATKVVHLPGNTYGVRVQRVGAK